MEVMAAQLRETYAEKDTEELIELRARNNLTDIARVVLDAELAKMGVDETAIVEVRTAQIKEEQRKVVAVSNLAPLFFRLAANILDTTLACIVLFSINFPLYLYTSKEFSDAVGWISIFLFLAYLLFKDGFNGQSIGTRLLKIKVMERNSGEPCSLPKSFIRNIVGWLGIFDLLFIFGKERRRLGDIAANTYVVKA